MSTPLSFTYTSDSLGYMIYCNGKPLGGARSSGTATRTSWNTRRAWQNIRADLKMFVETARRTCEELSAGNGPAYMRRNLP